MSYRKSARALTGGGSHVPCDDGCAPGGELAFSAVGGSHLLHSDLAQRSPASSCCIDGSWTHSGITLWLGETQYVEQYGCCDLANK